MVFHTNCTTPGRWRALRSGCAHPQALGEEVRKGWSWLKKPDSCGCGCLQPRGDAAVSPGAICCWWHSLLEVLLNPTCTELQLPFFSFPSSARYQEKHPGACSVEGMDVGQASSASLEASAHTQDCISRNYLILKSKQVITEKGETKSPAAEDDWCGFWCDAVYFIGSGSFALHDWKRKKRRCGPPETCFCMVNGLREGARICLAIGTAGSGGVYFPERERAGHNSSHKRHSGKKMDKCHRNLKDILLGYVQLIFHSSKCLATLMKPMFHCFRGF